MRAGQPQIASLQAAVRAAQHEFDMAITFHELWKPAAYDKDLHTRMGESYATNAFHVVRTSLRREMLLALMRLWDTDSRSVQMESLGVALRDKRVIDALATERANNIGLPEAVDQMRLDLTRLADEAVTLIGKYSKGGPDHATLKNIRRVRHQFLAHRQIKRTAEKGPNATDAEIESFYQTNLELVRLLLHLVVGVSYNPEESAEIHRRYATHFWAGVRGERTEGHPNYRPPRI